ncbi:MAG: hypothetical protein MUE36_14395 [Acidimicrobiales bacterium]|jgi:hypothetical protein|nr:hypothetical protein [Acidimicrobiales bacterium]
MARRRWFGVLALVGWTFFVWGNRLVNAWGSDTEGTGDKVVSTVLALAFFGLAAAATVVLVRTWRRPLTVGAARVLQVFAALTVVVWAVRVPLIALGDHEVGFVVVHAAIGIVAIALAVGVWRTASRVEPRPSAPGREGGVGVERVN